MKYIFKKVKEEFMQIQTMEDWESIRKKYPDMLLTDMDNDMKEHMDKVFRGVVESNNTKIHCEDKK